MDMLGPLLDSRSLASDCARPSFAWTSLWARSVAKCNSPHHSQLPSATDHSASSCHVQLTTSLPVAKCNSPQRFHVLGWVNNPKPHPPPPPTKKKMGMDMRLVMDRYERKETHKTRKDEVGTGADTKTQSKNQKKKKKGRNQQERGKTGATPRSWAMLIYGTPSLGDAAGCLMSTIARWPPLDAALPGSLPSASA